jgi:release factor glutamine methyltransferase
MFPGFRRVYDAFKQAGLDDPFEETLRLFDALSGGTVRSMDLDAPASEELARLAAGRSDGTPVEYLLGKAAFMGLQLTCTPAALIPRAETELLARTALDLIAERRDDTRRLTVVDMGTGSGNLAVALAVHAPDVRILASDVSAQAADLARRQVADFQVQDRVTVLCGDLYEPLLAAGHAGTIDILVCNPPYLPTSTLAKLAREIIEHEPTVALDAGPYGINIYRRLITGAAEMLKPDGVLVFEIGAGQEKLVGRLLEGVGGYPTIRQHVDADGQVRVVSADRRSA